ncbi:MAG: hypothetical protein JXX14_01380 [Deltaproteobacteria bacterium]|nr:hypothetical protein [Deltaproteobacteria bacterium]
MNGIFAEADSSKPRLVFVSLAQDTDGLKDESAFLTSLQLNLDRYDIMQTDIQTPRFEELPTQFQVDAVYALVRQNNAHGAMWLTRGTNNALTLHVATLEAERAIFRLFRQNDSEYAEKELGRTVAELFESAYLLELEERGITESTCPPAPAETPEKEEASAPHRPSARWYLSASGRGALAGHLGPSLNVLGSTGVVVQIASNIGLKIGAGGGWGPFGKEAAVTVDGWSVFGEAEFRLNFANAGIKMGPVLGVSGGLQSVRVEQMGASSSYRYPKADAVLGFGFSIPVSQAWTEITFGLFMSPYRTVITDGNDGEIIYRNQAVGWFVSNEWYFF